MASKLGLGPFLAFLAVLVGGVVRLLKTERLNAVLAKLSLPPVPKRALPWLALTLGFALAMLEALARGEGLWPSLAQGLLGLFSGATAIGGDQTVGKLVEARKVPSSAADKPEVTASVSEQSPEP